MLDMTELFIDKRRIASYVNACIEVCFDGQKTYALAAADVRDASLKRMLQGHSDQRARFVIELQEALTTLGCVPENGGTLRGALRRALMETRHTLEANHDDMTILRQCIRDEEAALHRYLHATRAPLHASLPLYLRVVIDEHLASIEDALTSVRQWPRLVDDAKLSDEQRIDEAGWESFPASDPPSWTSGIDR